ncbi:MAG: HAD-IIB family hydrolase [Saprospiraceae bacterium]|nr:HAD-IIB family hydrolase [Saprospiraceae bacterium]
MTPTAPPTDRSLVVFTDLDGTLIDHHTYDIEASRLALQQLADRGVPLVFCSSKTFAEQRHLQDQLGMFQPFIFENGSAAAIPHGFFPENLYTAARREQGYDVVVFAHADAVALRAALAHLPEVRGYAAASDAELAAATGLTGDALGRARARWFTETLLSPLNEEQAVAIGQRLKPDGFSLSRGGRFYTVQSDAVNKGRTVQWMMNIFRQALSKNLHFAAVCDSLHDLPMLQVVDLPFLVQRPDRTWATMDIPHLTRIEAVGPVGFSAVVSKLLVI